MTKAIIAAHEAGQRARSAGWSAVDNPHNDWWLGVAWAAGWHGMPLETPAAAVSSLEVQLGLLVA
jgi:hypothetical protein